MSSHKNPTISSNILKNGINVIDNWLKFYRINVDETKSTHVTIFVTQRNMPASFLKQQCKVPGHPFRQKFDVETLYSDEANETKRKITRNVLVNGETVITKD